MQLERYILEVRKDIARGRQASQIMAQDAELIPRLCDHLEFMANSLIAKRKPTHRDVSPRDVSQPAGLRVDTRAGRPRQDAGVERLSELLGQLSAISEELRSTLIRAAPTITFSDGDGR